jgi:hypothetical protein
MSAVLSSPVRTVVLRARDLALTEETEGPAVRPGHLLLALLEEPDSSATRLLGELCDVTRLRQRLAERLTGSRQSPWWEAPEIPYAAGTQAALALAGEEAEAGGEPELRPVHLLHGLFGLTPDQWGGDLEALDGVAGGIEPAELKARILAAGTA